MTSRFCGVSPSEGFLSFTSFLYFVSWLPVSDEAHSWSERRCLDSSDYNPASWKTAVCVQNSVKGYGRIHRIDLKLGGLQETDPDLPPLLVSLRQKRAGWGVFCLWTTGPSSRCVSLTIHAFTDVSTGPLLPPPPRPSIGPAPPLSFHLPGDATAASHVFLLANDKVAAMNYAG